MPVGDLKQNFQKLLEFAEIWQSHSSKSGSVSCTWNLLRNSSPCSIHRVMRELRLPALPAGSFCRRISASFFKFSRYQWNFLPPWFLEGFGRKGIHLASQPSLPARSQTQCLHKAFHRSPPQSLGTTKTIVNQSGHVWSMPDKMWYIQTKSFVENHLSWIPNNSDVRIVDDLKCIVVKTCQKTVLNWTLRVYNCMSICICWYDNVYSSYL